LDKWFNKKRYDRCGASLGGGRTMSRFDTACLCMRCAGVERHHPDYERAVEANLAEIRKDNRNFKGIDYPKK